MGTRISVPSFCFLNNWIRTVVTLCWADKAMKRAWEVIFRGSVKTEYIFIHWMIMIKPCFDSVRCTEVVQVHSLVLPMTSRSLEARCEGFCTSHRWCSVPIFYVEWLQFFYPCLKLSSFGQTTGCHSICFLLLIFTIRCTQNTMSGTQTMNDWCWIQVLDLFYLSLLNVLSIQRHILCNSLETMTSSILAD